LKGRESRGQHTYSAAFYTREYYKDIVAFLKAIESVPGEQITMFSDSWCKVTDNKDYFLSLYYFHSQLEVTVYASAEFCENFKKLYGKEDNKVQLTWWYTDEHREFNEKDLDLEFNYKVYDEYYPYIDGGLDAFFDRYQKSPASILLLMGDPGVGKTTFIKEYIKKFKLKTVVTYDEKVMTSDYFYIQYLIDNNKNLLVIEDADALLAPREGATNTSVSKLLNVSEGLVKLESKKVVFSTNIQKLRDIDEAIVRPGRCFDVVKFRALTAAEAAKACEVGGLPPLTDGKDEYTLAQLFNRERRSYVGTKMGMI
jgi:hypothetical protein